MANSQFNLPPPPSAERDINDYVWRDWFNRLRQYIVNQGQILWSQINFTGSKLTDIQSRSHQDLQNLQGGTPLLSEYYHLGQVQYTDLTDGGDTNLHYHSSDRDLANATNTLAVNHGGTGQTSYTDGQLLIGNSTGNTLTKATLTQGSGISISNGNGSITITNTSPSSGGTVTQVNTGTGLSGGPITTTGTISFSNSNVATWAATPSSANLAAAMTDETGSGKLVFADGPTLSGPTIDGTNPYIQFNNGSAVTLAAGKMWYDGSTGSLNFGMGGGNITQQVGEEIFIYGKASAAITEGQLIVKTGTVGASGVITFGPAPASLTTNDGIIGVATENIALNGFGRITYFGVVHGINTTGASVGETWHDNDTLWYNPAGSGTLTNVKPSAPNIKYAIATVINAGSGGSGSIQVDLQPGSTLGGTDSNVQINGSLATNDLLQYNGTYWENVAPSSISIGTATNADNIKTVSTATNANFYMTFVDSNNSPAAYEALYTDAGVTYNPSTNSITSGISGGTF